MSVTQVSSFDVKNLSVSPLKALDNGAKMAYINYNGSKLILQAPSMMTPYGMDTYDKGPKVKYSVQFSMREYETNPKMKAFYDTILLIDNFMIDQGVKNSKVWFKKEQGREMVSEFYTSLARFSKDAEGNVKPYPPTIKLNLVNKDGNFTAKVFDDKKVQYQGVPMEELIVRNMQAITTIEFAFVWLADKKFGVTTNAHQLVITKLPESMLGCGIVVEDGDEEVAPTASVVAAVKKPATLQRSMSSPAAVVTSVLDAVVDDEEAFTATTAPTAPIAGEAVDEEPVPVPKKTVAIKKKVVVKSK